MDSQLPNQPLQQPVASPPPVPSSGMPRVLLIIFAFVVLIVITAGAYILGTKKEQAATVPTPTPDLYREPNGSAATANWKTYTDPQGYYSFEVPADFKTYAQVINDPSQKNVNPQSLYSLDTTWNQQGGWPLGGIEVRSGIIFDQRMIIQEKTQNPPTNSGRRDDSFIPNGLMLLKDTTIMGTIADQAQDRTYLQADFFISNYLIKISCIGDITRCKKLMPQVLSTLKFIDQNQTENTSNWKTYTNSGGYSVKYPETLTLTSEQFQSSDIENAAGIAIQQKQDGYDKPLLKIYIVDPANPSIPDKFSSLKELADISYKKNINNQNTPIKSISAPYETTFNGKQAYGFTIESKGFELAWTGFLGERGIIKAIIFQHNNKYFLIGYYDTPEFNQILSTFRFD